MAVLPKQKLIVQGSKSPKEAPNVTELKIKRYGCTSKTKVDCLYRNVTKKCLNLKGTKKGKKTPIEAKFKQNIGLYFQNPNLLYTLVGPKNQFEPQTQ